MHEYACVPNVNTLYTTCLHVCTPVPSAYRSIFQERLQRAGEQQAGKIDGLNDAAGAAAAAEPSVSFFGLIKEGRLSRNQAATLFYQVCGEQEGALRVGASGAMPCHA
jgi:hypothetical protein